MNHQQAFESRLMLAFEGSTPPEDVLTLLASQDIAGFTLFRPFNYTSPEQVLELTTALQRAAAQAGHLPLLLATDQEGGQLNAMGSPATLFAGNMALGATRDAHLAHQIGHAIGLELASMGININYAPVCDVNTNPNNPGLGIRAISDDPYLTAKIATALTTGMQSAGVAATLKHFPGAGEARVDSHYQMPLIDHPRARLDSCELVPFRAALQAGAHLLMTGHFAIPALSNTSDVPATLSRSVIHGFLRGELGFDGVIITDAFDMGAITQGAGQLVDAIAALRADVDLLLLTADREVQTRIEAGLKLAYTRGLIEDCHLVESVRRISALRRWVGTQIRPGLEVVGCPEHRALAKALAEKSITLVRDDASLLPLPSNARILAVMPAPKNLTPADTSETVKPTLASSLQKYCPSVDEIITQHTPSGSEIDAIYSQTANYNLLVIGTLSASMNPAQAALVNRLLTAEIPVITVAMRTPYDLRAYSQASTHLCTYSILPESMDALSAALFGKMTCVGKLPVNLDGSNSYPS